MSEREVAEWLDACVRREAAVSLVCSSSREDPVASFEMQDGVSDAVGDHLRRVLPLTSTRAMIGVMLGCRRAYGSRSVMQL